MWLMLGLMGSQSDQRKFSQNFSHKETLHVQNWNENFFDQIWYTKDKQEG